MSMLKELGMNSLLTSRRTQPRRAEPVSEILACSSTGEGLHREYQIVKKKKR